jgi:SAM-dependent methyltransferase
MDMGRLYQGDYVDATYGEDRVAATFKRIISLPPGQSDNEGRVRRLVQFARRHLQLTDGYTPKVLDVGSGLCVFLHRLAREGWACLALDPDPRMAAHARRRVGVPAVCGEFLSFHNLGLFEVVAFNKVLEHVTDPVGMLAHARNFLRPGGFVYLEVPDGEAAWEAGPGREEFFIEHYHVFSWKSVANLVTLAGYDLLNRERLREPSGKFTLRVFSGIRCGQEQRELSP